MPSRSWGVSRWNSACTGTTTAPAAPWRRGKDKQDRRCATRTCGGAVSWALWWCFPASTPSDSLFGCHRRRGCAPGPEPRWFPPPVREPVPTAGDKILGSRSCDSTDELPQVDERAPPVAPEAAATRCCAGVPSVSGHIPESCPLIWPQGFCICNLQMGSSLAFPPPSGGSP